MASGTESKAVENKKPANKMNNFIDVFHSTNNLFRGLTTSGSDIDY